VGFWRRKRDKELAEEVTSHLAMAAREHVERGSAEGEAQRAARKEFGNVGLVTETTRDVWGWRWLEDLADDIRYGVRAMRKNKGFASAAILTLALGIGANTAIFSVLNAAMLRVLPVQNPKELVFPQVTGAEGPEDGFAYREFELLRDRSRSFSDIFAFDTTRLVASADGQADLVWGQCVSGNFFSVLGVSPAVGRAFDSEDDRPEQTAAIVISDAYWERRFGRDPGVVGKQIVLKNIASYVAGVAPASFRGIELGDSVDIWVPMTYWPQLRLNDHLTVAVMGRLARGVSEQQAAAELTVLDRAIARQKLAPTGQAEDLNSIERRRVALSSGARGFVSLPDELPRQLNILMMAVGLVLLIACANVANLQLARGVNRKREIAVRLALGAGRLRLLRQLLTESLLLAAAGGGLGCLMSRWTSELLLRFAIRGVDANALDVQADLRVACFTAGISIATGLLFGLLPALGATRIDAAPALKAGPGGPTGKKPRISAGNVLVIGQVALCVALLVGAGLMVRSLKQLSRVNPGFRKDHILLVSLYPTLGGYQGERELSLYAQLQEQMDTAPGVVSASLSRFRFPSRARWDRKVATSKGAVALVACKPVAPRFFTTMGISLARGRDFTALDRAKSLRVAILSEALARAGFPDQDAIGQTIKFPDESGTTAEVVGVARDVRSTSLRGADAVPLLYIPLAQTPADLLGQATLEVRTTGEASTASAAVREVLRGIDRNLAVPEVNTQEEQIAESMEGEESLTTLLSSLGVLAILLASVGLYGVVAYSVARRTREIGIRVALGANRRDVMALVLSLGVRWTLAGVGIGLAMALLGARVLASELFGVRTNDFATFMGVATLMTAIALAASCIPARRAMGVDPNKALRYE